VSDLSSTNSVITIDSNSSLPIYKQIIEAVKQAISDGLLHKGDIIPSVNNIASEFSIARGSIFKAYNELRTAGIIDSVPGKGYFVTSTNVRARRNIFLLLSTFNPYREVMYNSFMNTIKNRAKVDIYFHHHNIQVFETLIQSHAAHYNTFVIMPEIHKQTAKVLNQLDQKKLYVLDSGLEEFGKKYPSVCQNYKKDIYNFFKSHIEKLEKYKRVVLFFPDNIRTYGVITGFTNFFHDHNMKAEVIKKTSDFKCRKHDLCLVIDDNDLVRLIHTTKSNNWTIGEDIGIISYNETPLKSVIADGITTITTDFDKMGSSMAEMILTSTQKHLENPFIMIDRNSF
jgi:DNA-binding transcriptional regulator YhcF (GntR family)